MGAVAARLSDLVVVTSDNPRSEDPERIIEEIQRGIVMPADRIAPKGQSRGTPSLSIVDRREAIEKAIKEATSGDLLLIAGKGHEKYQVIGDRTLPFDDVEVARRALARRRSGSRVTTRVKTVALTAPRLPPRRRGCCSRGTRRASAGAIDTRHRWQPGDLFVAIRGESVRRVTTSSLQRWPRARPARW